MSVASDKAARVLDAARRLFVDNGFSATSMDAIAARAGVSKATVYAHYVSKEALFAATARRECERVTGQMTISEDAGDLSLEAALTRIGGLFLSAICSEENVTLFRMVIAETPRLPELGTIFYECAPGLALANLSAHLRRARARGLLVADDCERAAAQFLGMLRGDLYLRRLLDQPVARADLDRATREAVKTFLYRYAA